MGDIQILDGMEVYDVEGAKVGQVVRYDKNLGTVDQYDGDSGYMRIEKDGFTIKNVFLPVTTISYLDDEGIHLSENKDTIMHRFNRLPDVAASFFGP